MKFGYATVCAGEEKMTTSITNINYAGFMCAYKVTDFLRMTRLSEVCKYSGTVSIHFHAVVHSLKAYNVWEYAYLYARTNPPRMCCRVIETWIVNAWHLPNKVPVKPLQVYKHMVEVKLLPSSFNLILATRSRAPLLL